MTTRTWNGSAGAFFDDAAWSPAGAPQAGDVAVINAGSVAVGASILHALTLQLHAAAANPALNLAGSTLDAATRLEVSGASGRARIGMAGSVVNNGLILFSGASATRLTTTLSDAADGTPGSLRNTGSIAAIDASPNLVASGTQQIVNNGAISVWNPSRGAQFAIVGPALTGSGAVMVDAAAQIELVDAVGAGQLVQFLNGGAGQSTVQLDTPGAFAGTFAGFAATDTITLRATPFTSLSWAQTSAEGGQLTVLNGSATSALLKFNGIYQTSDFAAADVGGGLATTITTTKAAGDQIFHMTDPGLGVSTTDAGETYTGPVSYLQHQFIWSSPDAVAISASAPNVFLKGGTSGDALAVSSGQNVLDGGAGSNFLVGGTGAGSADTFFVDGRGGLETWSTIVNFHEGDAATIFGFHPGTSTLPFTASDGAAGYTGLTIHSELNGAGTGVNGSMTFAGLDQATADAHFSITSGTLSPGTADAIDYLLIQYNR